MKPEKLRELPLRVLLLIILGFMALSFGCNAALWWVAQRSPWWLFALSVTTGTFAWQGIKSTRDVLRKRRRRDR